jgi:hypothetical protein
MNGITGGIGGLAHFYRLICLLTSLRNQNTGGEQTSGKCCTIIHNLLNKIYTSYQGVCFKENVNVVWQADFLF